MLPPHPLSYAWAAQEWEGAVVEGTSLPLGEGTATYTNGDTFQGIYAIKEGATKSTREGKGTAASGTSRDLYAPWPLGSGK